ncbi:hypothetical protein VPH35_049390 [Triticum aestivum]|uniref:Wall-associated receptor kinase galacturonan-binding domain-containing protein n=1 Tax=Triticum aestivum TaxID=4565 RepID=A0A077RUV2_WHEAT|nr:unnamed protein product [Triticum aestivum]
MLAGAKEEHRGEYCPAERCGNLTVSNSFWIANEEVGRSCGPLDFQVSCLNDNNPFLLSSGFTAFGIMDIWYEDRNLRVVDVHKEKDFNVSKSSCNFPSRNTSSKLALPFKVNPTNMNLIFYKCTKMVALLEVRYVNASNMFVHAGVRFGETGNYDDYALEGCDAIIVPVMGSSGWANASDYEQLISHGAPSTAPSKPAPASSSSHTPARTIDDRPWRQWKQCALPLVGMLAERLYGYKLVRSAASDAEHASSVETCMRTSPNLSMSILQSLRV